MTALYIIAGIFLFLFLLLMIPVSFYFKFDGEPELILKYLFIKIRLVPPKEKPQKQKGKPKEDKKQPEKKPEEKENVLKKLYKKRGLDGLLEIIGETMSIVKNTSIRILKHTLIRKLKIDLLIVGDDAADTAMKYAYVCSAVYPAVSFIDSNMNLRRKEIDIEAGFNKRETRAFAEARVSIRPWFALGAIISAAFRGIKLIFTIKKDIED